MQWTLLSSGEDAENLMRVFGEFHDACLREVHIWTDTFVTADLHMHCARGLDARIRVLVQRQWNEPSAVELLFEEVLAFRFVPSQQERDPSIFEAILEWTPESVFWSDTVGPSSDLNPGTWVRCRKMAWRDASEWMGRELRYGPASSGG